MWRHDLAVGLSLPYLRSSGPFPAARVGGRLSGARVCLPGVDRLTSHLRSLTASRSGHLLESRPAARRRIFKQRQQSEQSLGAALRRLRKQSGLRREDFAPGVAAKTIARIEQGRVQRIQKKTLAVLAQRLQLRPEEIASF